MKISLLWAAALSAEVTFAIPFGGLVPSKGKLLLPRVRPHGSGHRNSQNARPHEIPSHRDANQRSRQGYIDGSGRYNYHSPAWYKESQAEMTDAFGRMNIEKNFWNKPDSRPPNPGESKRTLMVEDGVQVYDTTFGDRTGQHGVDLRPESLGGIPTDSELYGPRPVNAGPIDRDEKYGNSQGEPNTNADTWVGKPPYMVMGAPKQESIFIDSPALRGSKDWVNAHPGSQMRYRSNLSQKEKDNVWANRDKIQIFRGPHEPGLFPNPPLHEIKPAWDSYYLHPFPDRHRSAPPNRKKDRYLNDKYIDPHAPRHRSSSPSARSYEDMVVRDKKKDRSRRDKHRLSESSYEQPPRRPPPRLSDSDDEADIVEISPGKSRGGGSGSGSGRRKPSPNIVEISPGGRYKRDAVDMAADKQTNAESTKPDVDMDEFKLEYQGAMDYFVQLQDNATDIIMPIIEDMVAGSNSDDIYGMAWEIISLIEPRIVFPPSGLFYQGTHACDWYEEQLRNKTDTRTMKEITDVHTVLVDIYMDGWERATNALNEGGLLENLYNVTNTLALNSNQSIVADLILPDTGYKKLVEFMDGLENSSLTDIPPDLLNGTSPKSNSTYTSGNGTFIVDNFLSTNVNETSAEDVTQPTANDTSPSASGDKTPQDSTSKDNASNDGTTPITTDDEHSQSKDIPKSAGDDKTANSTSLSPTGSNGKATTGGSPASDTEDMTRSSNDSNKTPTSESKLEGNSSSSTTTAIDPTQQGDETEEKVEGETKEGTQGEPKEGEPNAEEPKAGEPNTKETQQGQQ
ncbi:MAG: hypothetical protein Q9182_006971 [Xanthomendoza sp. 2 TL-2023]